jgi:Variant SH3 domain
MLDYICAITSDAKISLIDEANMQAANNHKGVGRVTAEHVASYNDPITMRANDELTLSDKEDNWHGWTWIWCTNQAGKSGWVPAENIAMLPQ